MNFVALAREQEMRIAFDVPLKSAYFDGEQEYSAELIYSKNTGKFQKKAQAFSREVQICGVQSKTLIAKPYGSVFDIPLCDIMPLIIDFRVAKGIVGLVADFGSLRDLVLNMDGSQGITFKRLVLEETSEEFLYEILFKLEIIHFACL